MKIIIITSYEFWENKDLQKEFEMIDFNNYKLVLKVNKGHIDLNHITRNNELKYMPLKHTDWEVFDFRSLFTYFDPKQKPCKIEFYLVKNEIISKYQIQQELKYKLNTKFSHLIDTVRKIKNDEIDEIYNFIHGILYKKLLQEFCKLHYNSDRMSLAKHSPLKPHFFKYDYLNERKRDYTDKFTGLKIDERNKQFSLDNDEYFKWAFHWITHDYLEKYYFA